MEETRSDQGPEAGVEQEKDYLINQLQSLLHCIGFQSPNAFCRLYAVEFSSRAGKHQEWYEDLMLRVHHLLPFLARMQVATSEYLERSIRRM